LVNILAVGTTPVDSLARWAALEAGLGFENVGRNLGADPILAHPFQGSIAPKTACEEAFRRNIVAEKFEYFPNLSEQVFIFNHQTARDLQTLLQPPISRQSNAAFGEAASDDLIIFDAVVINGIVSQNSQPPGQATQHDICEKLGAGRTSPHFSHPLYCIGAMIRPDYVSLPRAP
jgi:hypothetical protein